MFEKLQRSILFPAEFAIPPSVDVVESIENLSSHWIETDEGRTEYFFLSASGDEPKPVVFFAHGNAELIDYWPEMLSPYTAMGFHVALIEYRGYGRSKGSPSEVHITDDFVAGYDQVVGRSDVDESHVVFHGRSLGGGAMGSLARHRTPSKMILESTFTSVKEMAKVMFPFAEKFVVDPFETIEVVKSVEYPILIMHGAHDEIVAFQHAKALAAAAQNSTLVSFEAGHNDFPPDAAQYWRTIEKFVRS